MNCPVCSSTNVKVEEKEGRGLAPKGWVRKPGDNRKISWKGLWNIYTCKCGNIWKKLIR